MTAGREPSQRLSFRPGGRGRARRRRSLLAWLARIVILAVVFWLGIALGRALEETSRGGGTQVRVRTLEPDTIRATRTRTVTVTVTRRR